MAGVRPRGSPAAGFPISPRRDAFDRAVQGVVLGTLLQVAQHWLLLLNSAALLLLLLPTLLAPAFRAWGWDLPTEVIFWAYASICHQMPSRSFFLFGEQMAFCQRNAAIFAAFWFFGMVYILFRRRLRPLPTWLAVAYSLPLAVDGFTQLFGWRESTWELRVATGAFFGLAAVWYVFPHLELSMLIMGRQLREQLLVLGQQTEPQVGRNI